MDNTNTKQAPKCPHCKKPLEYENSIADHHECPACHGKIVAEKQVYPVIKHWHWAKR